MTVGGLITVLGAVVTGTILLIGFIQLLKRGTKKAGETVPPPPIRGDTRKCPSCAETIKLEALICRYCGHKFTQDEVREAKVEVQLKGSEIAQEQRKLELARQQQRQIKRLKGRRTRRLVFGILLTWMGVCMTIGMIVMFFSSPAPGNTAEQQKIAAALGGLLFGVVPLIIGIVLLRAARFAKRALLAERDRLAKDVLPPTV